MNENDTTEKNSDGIPQKLLDLIKAEDTTLEIARICFENEINEDAKIRGISYQTGRVLVGDLPPKEFQKTLEEKIGISPFSALKISQEISESIFSQTEEELTAIYGEEAVLAEKSTAVSPDTKEKKSETIKSLGQDNYREPI